MTEDAKANDKIDLIAAILNFLLVNFNSYEMNSMVNDVDFLAHVLVFFFRCLLNVVEYLF